ncbi:hypothetical protein [Paraliomyxa miuraensis]|uniref:hypothetical protein n=1 Tax=Paraliomyxa miuraensis TaxID=376150 RepID=UPI0022520E39|nr:hypothetical protein [Paraliomyxa miuraensis]MCX4241943.1 hypothetical protein [Paraliomyxa miuraensis]
MPPSFIHQGLTKLVTEHPELWPVLLQRSLDIALPEGLQASQGPETVRQLRASDHTADGTVVLQRIRDGTPEEAFVNEIQCGEDDDKWWTWPIHLAGVRARLRCPTTLVVLTPCSRIARWASRPIDIGRGRMTLRPLVIGPKQIPRTMDLEDARRHPELATLAVMVHGRRAGSKRLNRVALQAVHERLDANRGGSTLLLELITASIDAKTRREIEDVMEIGTNISFTRIGRRKFAEGHARGREEGREEGRREACRRAIALVLQSRGLNLAPAHRRRLARCDDDQRLESWLCQAATVERARELFAR